MMDDLKPCPFCGGDEVSASYCTDTEGNISGRFVECEVCAANGPITKVEAEAIAAWNQRDRIEALTAEKDKLGNLLLETAAKNAREIVRLEVEIERLRAAVPYIIEETRKVVAAEYEAAMKAMADDMTAKFRAALGDTQ